MLRKTTIEDFTQLKYIAENRLSPDGISIFFFGAVVFSLVMTTVSALAIKLRMNELHPDLSVLANVAIGIWLLQLAATLFFISMNNSFKYQRLQSVVLTVVAIKFSIDMFFLFLVCTEVLTPLRYMTRLGIYIFVGGLVYLLICTIRGIIRVRSGYFRRDGKMFYDFKDRRTKIFVGIPFLYVAFMIGWTITRHSITFSGPSADSGLYFALLIGLTLQYGMAMAIPEFFLLTYCKFRFTDFHVQPSFQMKNRKSQNIIYWSKRPLVALKSRSGWKTVEEAPRWAILLVGLQLFAIIFIPIIILSILGILLGTMGIDEMGKFLLDCVVLFSILVLLLLIVLRILLWILGKLFKK